MMEYPLAATWVWKDSTVIQPDGMVDFDAVTQAPAPFRFSVDQFWRMLAAGVLPEEVRLELWAGELMRMSPWTSRHQYSVQKALSWLSRQRPAAWHARTQAAVIHDGHVVYPDVALVRGTNSDQRKPHHADRDIALIVEVADESIEFDRTEKAELYASMGVTEYWLVDLSARRVLLHREPRERVGEIHARYRTLHTIKTDGGLVLAIDGPPSGVIPVADLIG